MTTLRHVAASFGIMALLFSLVVTIYHGFEDKYNVEPQDLQDGKSVMDKLDNLPLLQGINEIGEAVQRLGDAKLSLLAAGDILGALATAGAGVLKIIGGIVTFIPAIFGIVTDFYFIPPMVTQVIGALTILYVGLIILSKYLRDEV